MLEVLLTMTQGSTRFEHLEKPTDDHILEQQNKNTRVKTTRDVKLLIESLTEKHDQGNAEDIEDKLMCKYRTSALSIKKTIFIQFQTFF